MQYSYLNIYKRLYWSETPEEKFAYSLIRADLQLCVFGWFWKDNIHLPLLYLNKISVVCLLYIFTSRGRSERESLCKRCAVDRFNVKHKEQCRTLCPGVSSRPVWPPPGHLQGKEEKEEEDRVEVETSSWPAWPPSPDHCARCSRPRYRWNMNWASQRLCCAVVVLMRQRSSC